MYERPEKRARLTLLEDSDPRIDVFDEGHQVAVNSGQYEQLGLGRGVPPAAIGNSPDFYNYNGRVASPAWRDDDKDGHYMFELGENITPRCNHTFNPGRSVRPYARFSLHNYPLAPA